MKRMVVVMLAGLALAGCGDSDVRKAHAEVAKLLNDGGSAEFRSDRVLYLPPGQQKIVCGEVNAKNQLGAYAGYTPYVVESIDTVPYAKFSRENTSDIRITCSLGKPH